MTLIETLYEESQDDPDSILWKSADRLEQAEKVIDELVDAFESYIKYMNLLKAKQALASAKAWNEGT